MSHKYGDVCLTCSKTVSYGVNKDGECKSCALGRRPRRSGIFTATKGRKTLRNLPEFDARQYASVGGWKVTGFEKSKKPFGGVLG